MDARPPLVLQLCPFSRDLEQALDARYEVRRWFRLDASEQAAFLEREAVRVQGIATAGNTGCPPVLMRALPGLRIVAVNGVGVDKVDLALARARGITVTTTPGVLTDDVADLAVGLVLALLREIPAGDAYVRAGSWLGGDRPVARKVSGRRFGIVGLGQIGLATAQRLASFGPVAYTGPHRKDVPYPFHATAVDLARAVDVLVLTLPANASTRHLIDGPVLEALGSQGWLVNVARGAVVDELALIAALEAGRIAGAALDVFEDEPRVPEALRRCPRVVLTPHVGTATRETRRLMDDIVLASLASVLSMPQGG